METAGDVVRRLWALCGVLRDDGVSYHEYMSELSTLLFLKLADELDVERYMPERFAWTTLSALASNDELLLRYQETHKALASSPNAALRAVFEGQETKLTSGRQLRRLVDGISNIDWYRRGQNVVGDIYEGLIEKNAAESRYGAGQYFTPRPLVDLMVTLTRPDPGDRVYDPAVGTAGFLVAAGEYSAKKSGKMPELVGQELVPAVRRLAVMNLMLHDMEGRVELGDTLSVPPESVAATVCLTNPPFGVRGGLNPEQKELFEFPTSNKQLAFLQHAYRSVQEGGRGAIIVPDNVLFENGVAAAVRTAMLDTCDVHTILRLPPGIFYATGVRTSVIFFAKTKPTRKIWTFDLRTGLNSFTKKRPLSHEDLASFVDVYGPNVLGRSKRTESDRFTVAARESLRRHNDTLDLHLYSTRGDEEGNADPESTAQVLVDELENALAAAQAVVQLLRDHQDDVS